METTREYGYILAGGGGNASPLIPPPPPWIHPWAWSRFAKPDRDACSLRGHLPIWDHGSGLGMGAV